METSRLQIQDGTPLAYRLRKTVRYHEIESSLHLSLDYPLKAIVLNPIWKPTIHLLDRGPFIPIDDILPLIEPAVPEKIEAFLNALVRKGFLESEGYPSLNEYPFVSIIIPVRNRPKEIADCLESLGRLDYPADKREVIVVDDASDDNTPDVVSGYPVHLIPLKEHRQASFCRNLASRKAKGEILAFLDSDCLADPLWLKGLIPAFRDSSNGAAGGMVDSTFNEKGLDRYEKVKSSLNMGFWPRSSREGDLFFYLPSCNLLIRRALFNQLGGFKEDMAVGEDVDLCWRLRDQGHHVEYRPVGRVTHKHRNSIKPFLARRFEYGASEPLLQRTHADRIKQFSFSLWDPIFWGLVLLTIASGWMPLLILCGVILLIDSLIRFGRIRRRHIPIHFPRILLAAFRGYLAVFYHWCAFVSRYYLYFALLLLMPVPVVSAVILGMHLLTGILEYFIKKPRLNLPLFLFYFTLDQLSYQLGVWWGCLKGLFFSPVNPRIKRRPNS